MIEITKHIINQNNNIRTTLKKMDLGGIGLIVIVNDDEKVVGIVTDGDFRRSVLKGVSLDENVSKIANTSFKFVNKNFTEDEVLVIFNNFPVQHIPVLNEGKLIDIISKKSIYKNHLVYDKIDIPVVIMAGGKGTRLAPFTDVLPKPLIPIGKKTIIETIIDEFANYGIKDFYISVNYKAKLIKAFFEEDERNYNIKFIDETMPLGTAGALKLIENKIADQFFVSNCDIMIKDDYAKIFEFHKKGNFDITLVGSIQHHVIPYGVCSLDEQGVLTEIIEKPEYDFLVNTGMYVLNKKVLEYIPSDTFYHITHLIDDVKKAGGNIGVYPVSEKSWIDIGQWNEYKEFLNLFTK